MSGETLTCQYFCDFAVVWLYNVINSFKTANLFINITHHLFMDVQLVVGHFLGTIINVIQFYCVVKMEFLNQVLKGNVV